MTLVQVSPNSLDNYDDPDASVVALCERGSQAIEQAATVADAKDVRDWADTIEHAAKIRDLNHETIIIASALKIRAERRIGQLLGPAPSPGRPAAGNVRSTDIPRQRQSEYRELAESDEDDFEEALSEAADNAATKAGVSRRAVRDKLAERKRDDEEQAEWVQSLGDDPDPEATRLRGVAHRAVLGLIDGIDRLTKITPEELAAALATYPERQHYVRDEIVADVYRAASVIATYEKALP